MDKHPIENIMTTTMENIRDMVDVNTVVGEPIQAGDGSTIIPISRVSFGFVAGGAEYNCQETKRESAAPKPDGLPFGGGTGAGVSVQPVGFLVVSADGVRLLPAQLNETNDRIIELVPQVLGELKCWLRRKDDAKRQAQGEKPLN